MNTQIKKKQSPVKQSVKKTPTSFRIRVFSRHPSYETLRTSLGKLPFRVVCKFGSTTEVEESHIKGGKTLEINESKGIRNSSSKLLMKKCFAVAGVKTAPWFVVREGKYLDSADSSKEIKEDTIKFPVIVKSLQGSRGEGNTMYHKIEDFKKFIASHDMNNYIVENYLTYSREYRLHITNAGCFYTCRKMLKSDTPEEERYQRHSDTCSWFIESNPKFDKPVNWDAIVADCIKAKNALGLDICAFDVKIQSAKDKEGKVRENPEWILLESCSAPSMAEGTTLCYLSELPKVAMAKAKLFGII